MSKTVGVIHEARTNYPSISPVGFLFGGVCVAHPVRFLCCAGSFYLSLFCVLCSALSVSLESLFCVLCSALSVSLESLFCVMCSALSVSLESLFCVLCSALSVSLESLFCVLCSALSVSLESLFCVLCSALSVSLDCPFSVTYNQYSSKILKNARNVLQMKQGLLWLVFDTHKIAGFSSTRYPPQGLRFRNIFK
jgi:hypothetical protein